MVNGRVRGDENASRGVAERGCWRSMVLFARELYASPKPVATASPRLKLMTLSGYEKGFVASMVGVEKILAGVVARLVIILCALPRRS